jgi:hypothetical protein
MTSFAFYLTVYDDHELAERLIKDLSIFYPESPILVCVDGNPTYEFSRFCDKSGCEYMEGQRLKLAEFGGEWLVRMLQFYLMATDAECLIKLDPDSKINRRFGFIPLADLFGQIQHNGVRSYVQGGAIGCRRAAAETIIKSGFLLDAQYQQYAYSYRRKRSPYLQPGEAANDERLIAADVVLSDVAQRLQMVLAPWSEVLSFPVQSQLDEEIAGRSPDELTKQFALIHPWKYAT